MFGRVFWFAVGAGVTIYVVVKARDYIARHSPEALVEKVQHTVVDAGGEAKAFVARVRAATAEREAELRETLGLTQ
ncbi:DUF6167 family protein [Microlunatus phosphovorus]|uniref:DUF6167 family protein n=1 Tax=Microlunatus phosphovorus TaxID=29405 RepID=UPI000674EA66|nr:DUF6167 family protein [Microlunatus phosphovorus]